MRALLRPLLAAMIAGLVAVALVACGASSGAGGGSDASLLLVQTFTGHAHVSSGDLSLALRIEPNGGSTGPVAITLSGPFRSGSKGQRSAFDITLAVSEHGKSQRFGLTWTGGRAFLRLQGTAYSVPPALVASLRRQLDQRIQQAQARGRKAAQQLALAALGVDPLAWLQNAHVVGHATEGGVDTTHVAAQVNVSKLLDDVQRLLGQVGQLGIPAAAAPSLTPQLRQQIEQAVKAANVDLYTGSVDKILRRLTIGLRIQAPPGKASRSGVTGASVSLDVLIDGVNQPQTISAPAHPHPFAQAIRRLLGLGKLGSLGGAGALGRLPALLGSGAGASL